jgi:S-formylglutathione hydrolase FrmB
MATAAVAGGLGLPGARAGAAGSTSAADVVAAHWLGPRTLDVLIESPAMGATLPVRLLLPHGWSPNTTRRWPVLHLLHGGRDDYTSWTRETDIADLSARHDVIVAMPEGGRAGFYSDWWNRDRGGPPRWETFHLAEVVDVLRRWYGAGPARAVAGLSSGGEGALAYAARYPGMFRFAASYSGLADTLSPGVPELIMGLLASERLSPQALWGHPIPQAAIWRAHDPRSLAARLRGTGLYVSCGQTGLPQLTGGIDWADGVSIERVTARTIPPFLAALRHAGVPVIAHLYRGGTHSWPYWQRELHASWPLLMRALGEPGGG